MKTRLAYCSACDRDVEVLVPDGGDDPMRPADPASLACLEHGETCTGFLCPLFSVPPEEMRARLTKARGRSRRHPRGGDRAATTPPRRSANGPQER